MTQVICDVSKKVIRNAAREQNYYTFRGWTLSPEAKEQVEDIVKEEMSRRKPYTLEEYWNLYSDTIEDLSK